MMIREPPRTDLMVSVRCPDGNQYRWSDDAQRASDIASGISFATTMPGGFDTGQVTLQRDPAQPFPDLQELSTVQFKGAGGVIAGEYRLESAPATSGDSMQIQPGLVGWQSHLDDDASAQMVYIDQSLRNWSDPPLARQQVLAVVGATQGSQAAASDASGDPAIVLSFDGAWGTGVIPIAEAWYDIGSAATIATVYYDLAIGNGVGTNSPWSHEIKFGNDPSVSPGQTTSALAAGAGSVNTTSAYRYAWLQMEYATANAGIQGFTYQDYWQVAVIGSHGLTVRGSWPDIGLLSSDVEAHAVGQWATYLKFTTGTNGTIQPSTFVIPQLAFTSPTTVSAIIKAATQYELRDWAVWEGPTYYSNGRGTRGNRWLARSTDTKLQAAGPQIQDLFNGVIVTFQDSAGQTRYVGPAGSGADVEDDSLLDADPENPANQLGIRRWGPSPPLSIGVGSSDAAIAIGQAYLQQQKDLDQAGQASHVGYVQEASTGMLFPVWAMRAGDQVSYVDASDRSFRRIVSTSYDHSSRTNSIQLDSPPETLQALLLRYGVELTNG